ncbi:hypothetical protein Kisp02_26110 [Kineosporia sp. NBRC 101731]|nr:hypothetical protein Kisp02_26110 [Kineosporia sp. NBRC 101731]
MALRHLKQSDADQHDLDHHGEHGEHGEQGRNDTGNTPAVVALFLASDDSWYVNGLELVVESGTTAI